MLSAVSRGKRRLLARYLAASAFNLLAGQVTLAILFGVVRLGGRDANLVACAIGTGPAFLIARRWVWKRTGRSHLVREVLPFWVFSFVAVFLSTIAAARAEAIGQDWTSDRAKQTAVVLIGTALAYGTVFVVRFIVFNHLFRDPDGSEPAQTQQVA